MHKKIILFFWAAIIYCSYLSNYFVWAQESITITTYYPSPYGVYNTIVVKKMSVGDTNSDGQINNNDAPLTDNNLLVAGKVGVGIVAPISKVDVRDRYSGALSETIEINVGSSASSAFLPNRVLAIGYVNTSLGRNAGFIASRNNNGNVFTETQVIGNPMTVWTGNDAATATERLRVTTTGNVGVDIGSPKDDAPNGVTRGNIDANDVWLRGATPPRWASEGGMWPPGSYCIMLGATGVCPTGFSPGTACFDIEDTTSNAVAYTGNTGNAIIEGSQAGAGCTDHTSATLNFCCK